MTAFLFAVPPIASAQSNVVRVQAKITAKRTYAGQKIRLNIEIHGTTDVARPVVDAVPGLDMQFAGERDQSSSFVSIVNGRRTDRSTKAYVYQWTLTSPVAGEFMIPPIEVTADGVRHKTKPIRVRFIDPPTTENMLLDLSLGRESAYVGEPVRLTIDWYFTQRPKNWNFAFPGLDDSFELVSPASIDDRTGEKIEFQFQGRSVTAMQASTTVEGDQYVRLRIEQMLIPRETGTLRIGPVSVSADLVQREGFMRDVTEYFVARTKPIELNVRELPTEGRPRSFSGLIGEYRISAHTGTTRVSVGDPLEITTHVSQAFIQGRAVDLNNRHKRLWRKYELKYERQGILGR